MGIKLIRLSAGVFLALAAGWHFHAAAAQVASADALSCPVLMRFVMDGSWDRRIQDFELRLANIVQRAQIASQATSLDPALPSVQKLHHFQNVLLATQASFFKLAPEVWQNNVGLLEDMANYQRDLVDAFELSEIGPRLSECNGLVVCSQTEHGKSLRGNPLSPAQRDAYVLPVSIKNGLLVGAGGQVVDTRGERFIFVLNEYGELVLGNRDGVRGQARPNGLYHSDLVNEGVAAAAGEIVVVNGKIVYMNDSSGHYKPPRILTQQFVLWLHKKGADLSALKTVVLEAPEFTQASELTPELEKVKIPAIK